MKRLVITAGVLLCAITFFACTAAQLTTAQNDALKVQAFATTAATAVPSSTQPATQPTAITVRAILTGAESVAPGITPFVTLAGMAISLLGGGATVAAGIFGSLAKKNGAAASNATATANSAMAANGSLATELATVKASAAEILGDIASFKDPSTNWTTATAKLISDLGLNI